MNDPKSFAKYRVLIVDDNVMMRRLIISQLNSLGFQNIEKASNGLEALSKLEECLSINCPVNIVLLDWNMPEMNGMEFLKVCRAQKQYDRTAIVMVTAESEQRNVVQALKTGATSYITKPLALDTLATKLRQVVGWLEGAGARPAGATSNA